MKAIVVYNSKTGFTRRYAEWIAQAIDADCRAIDEIENVDMRQYDLLLFGSWVHAETLKKRDWIKRQLPRWKGRRVGVFAVGAMPAGDAANRVFEQTFTPQERTQMRTFYLQGGLDYARMSCADRLLMAFMRKTLAGQKDTKSGEMLKLLSESFDATDERAIEPIVQWAKN